MEFDAIGMMGPPGWVELRLRADGEQPPRVLAKFEEREGRVVPTRLILVADRLDSATMRAVPIGRVESYVNRPGFGAPTGLTRPMDPEVLADMAARGHLFPQEFEAIDTALDSFLAKNPEPVPGVRVTRRTVRRKPLVRPDGKDPDRFYRRVAEAYSEAVASTSKPAKVLADEAGVPVVTVHRWISEARRRGFLPPARKGRAG